MLTTIIFDPATGIGSASGSYFGQPTLNKNEVACTAAQAADPRAWKLVNNAIVAATAADMAPTLAQLTAALQQAASTACAALTTRVVPDATHQNAYVNAAAMVGPGAVVPTADPAKTAFANLAAANGAAPQAFATTVVAIAAVSWQLSATLAALNGAATAAKAAGDLAAALQAFEAALGKIVAAIGAAGVTVEAPAAISIPGINA